MIGVCIGAIYLRGVEAAVMTDRAGVIREPIDSAVGKLFLMY